MKRYKIDVKPIQETYKEKNTIRFPLQVAQGIPKHLDDELSKEYFEISEEEVRHITIIYFLVCAMKSN